MKKNGKIVKCPACKTFHYLPMSRLHERYCSKVCMYQHRRHGRVVMCAVCGKTSYRNPAKTLANRFYCSLACRNSDPKWLVSLRTRLQHPKGSLHPRWKGGRLVRPNGYVVCYMPTHPYPSENGTHVFEHRLVAEQHLGRFLQSDEIVHHKNANRKDNRWSNLEVLTKTEHGRLHQQERRRRALHTEV